MIGAQIENYKIVEKLGDGGMGSVYKAVDVMLEREVALKFLRPELAEQPDLVERFRTEAIVLAKLTHQNVAGLYGLHRHGSDFFMAMEFVPGQTIETLLKQSGKLDVERAATIATHVLHALEYAHRHGVVHRDIKSANVIATPAGGVKVMDFGIARVLGTERRTRVGFVVGTIGYMAPEQIQGLEVDGRTDIYAVGVVLYEMLTGRMPFQGETEYAVMQAQVQQMPVPPRVFAEMPAAVEACVMRALAKKPAERYQSAGEFVEALQAAVRQPSATASASAIFVAPAEETREFKSDPALLAGGLLPKTPVPPPAVSAQSWPATPAPAASQPSLPPYWPPAADLTAVRPQTSPPPWMPPPLPVPEPPPTPSASQAGIPPYTPPVPSASQAGFPPYTPPPASSPALASIPAGPGPDLPPPPAPVAPSVHAAVPPVPAPIPRARPSRGLPAPIAALLMVLVPLAIGAAGYFAWLQFRASQGEVSAGAESPVEGAQTTVTEIPAAPSVQPDGTVATGAGSTTGGQAGPGTEVPAPPAAGATPASSPSTPGGTVTPPQRPTGRIRTSPAAQAPKTAPEPVPEPAVMPLPPPTAPPPPLEPVRPALPPALFGKAKWMRVEGTRMREVDVFLRVSDRDLSLLDRRGRDVLLTVPLGDLSVALYSQGKRATWRADLGPAPPATAFDETLRTFHYVAFQGASRFLLVRVDRDDLARLREELGKRSSLALDSSR
jgi:serine/threonine-protein kinase